MKPFLGYIFLAIGISFGIASNSFAKISDGFTKLTPTILCILLMCITMFSLAKAMSVIPVGFAYSTYSGLSVTGVPPSAPGLRNSRLGEFTTGRVSLRLPG